MCRWLAYCGPPLPLSTLLMNPDHSLLDQSRNARENVETTNGDGFGVGWYADLVGGSSSNDAGEADRSAASSENSFSRQPSSIVGANNSPGLYHDTHPAWNDDNFKHLSRHIHSRLFFAHVRAATGTPVQNTNCHPFALDNWLFVHNGSVPGFASLKRQLLFDVDAELFQHIGGSTDSELLFFLALTFGLRDDPLDAMQRTIGHVERLCRKAAIERPIYFTAAVSDGRRIWAVRYSSNHQSRTLYHSRHLDALRQVDGSYETLPGGTVVVVSEPLDEMPDHWQKVAESTCIKIGDGQVKVHEFSPT